ncbi:DUF6114 domain-containing protein [Corynebacterium sp. P4_F2]|uniref:DUF6114 domain-containing protein n=1 Tax=unclassified Corynebacterium TaxID=2624378 RepID=UPI0026538620|nr:DUF6114 domain-containing protein [Corynebacterium sp. P4_F2]MDN8594411.1 DUF6114 domain-containing protein [Corynebacterium sp. P4_F2]
MENNHRPLFRAWANCSLVEWARGRTAGVAAGPKTASPRRWPAESPAGSRSRRRRRRRLRWRRQARREGRILTGLTVLILGVVAVPTSIFGGFMLGSLLAILGGTPPSSSRRTRCS